jgi:hypothetical protein
MMKQLRSLLLSLLAFAGCVGARADQTEADTAFHKLADEYIHGSFLFSPLSGVGWACMNMMARAELQPRIARYGIATTERF